METLLLVCITVPVTNFLTVFYGCPGVYRFQIVNYKDIVLFIVRSEDGFEKESLTEELDKRLGKRNYAISGTSDFVQSEFGKTPHFVDQTSVNYRDLRAESS